MLLHFQLLLHLFLVNMDANINNSVCMYQQSLRFIMNIYIYIYIYNENTYFLLPLIDFLITLQSVSISTRLHFQPFIILVTMLDTIIKNQVGKNQWFYNAHCFTALHTSCYRD